MRIKLREAQHAARRGAEAVEDPPPTPPHEEDADANHEGRTTLRRSDDPRAFDELEGLRRERDKKMRRATAAVIYSATEALQVLNAPSP